MGNRSSWHGILDTFAHFRHHVLLQEDQRESIWHVVRLVLMLVEEKFYTMSTDIANLHFTPLDQLNLSKLETRLQFEDWRKDFLDRLHSDNHREVSYRKCGVVSRRLQQRFSHFLNKRICIKGSVHEREYSPCGIAPASFSTMSWNSLMTGWSSTWI